MSVANFTLYLWTPVLVYDETYPRKDTRDIIYIIRKCGITLMGILASYIIHTDYVLIYIQLGNRIGFFELLTRCILPFLLIEIILFYVVFENITNVFA